MSEMSISTDTVQTMAMDNLFAAPEAATDQSTETASGLNPRGIDSEERTVAGAELVSRTEDYLGSVPDLTSTATDVDVQKAVQAVADTGIGSIADKIA